MFGWLKPEKIPQASEFKWSLDYDDTIDPEDKCPWSVRRHELRGYRERIWWFVTREEAVQFWVEHKDLPKELQL